jgi:hypothetical protein
MSKPALALLALVTCLLLIFTGGLAIKRYHIAQLKNGQIPSDTVLDGWAEKIPSWPSDPIVTNAAASMAYDMPNLRKYGVATMSSNQILALKQKLSATGQFEDLFCVMMYEEFKRGAHDPPLDIAKRDQLLALAFAKQYQQQMEYDLRKYRVATMSSNQIFALKQKLDAANQVKDLYRVIVYEQFRRDMQDPSPAFTKYQRLMAEEAKARGAIAGGVSAR